MPDPFRTLFQAILKDDVTTVKFLLGKDSALAKRTFNRPRYEPGIAHWFYSDDTALHVAAAAYRARIAEMLLVAGADVRSAGNHRRSQPLHYAADGYIVGAQWNSERQVATLALLLRAGADMHAKDRNGATPLHRAVRTRCAGAVKFLLTAGADAAARNASGSTPFHLAVQNTGRGGSGTKKARAAQLTIIETFLHRRVSPTLKDSRGNSVLDWAKTPWIRRLLSGNQV